MNHGILRIEMRKRYVYLENKFMAVWNLVSCPPRQGDLCEFADGQSHVEWSNELH